MRWHVPGWMVFVYGRKVFGGGFDHFDQKWSNLKSADFKKERKGFTWFQPGELFFFSLFFTGRGWFWPKGGNWPLPSERV